MDTLSSSVSTFTLPSLISTSREFCCLKTPSASPLLPNSHFSSTSKTSSILCKTTSYNSKRNSSHVNSFLSTSQTLSLKQSSTTVHQKAASGYAAALLDVARCNNFLEAIEKDVRRFLRLLNDKRVQSILTDPFVEVKEKGQVVKEVAEKGRFHKHLVVLLKLLVEKNGVGIVSDVLMEFQRIYDELSGTQVVLVPSAVKMEKRELFGIAKRVQKLSGAAKVKVRHIVDERLPFPSFAV